MWPMINDTMKKRANICGINSRQSAAIMAGMALRASTRIMAYHAHSAAQHRWASTISVAADLGGSMAHLLRARGIIAALNKIVASRRSSGSNALAATRASLFSRGKYGAQQKRGKTSTTRGRKENAQTYHISNRSIRREKSPGAKSISEKSASSNISNRRRKIIIIISIIIMSSIGRRCCVNDQ